MMWSKEFVNYEFSARMKKLGFKDPCMGYWECSLTSQRHEEDGFSGPFGWKEGELSFHKEPFENGCEFRDLSNENWLQCGAPTWQSAFRWLRGTHKLAHIWLMDEILDGGEKSYDEAEIEVLDELLSVLEKRLKENERETV